MPRLQLNDILAARRRVDPFIVKTPIVESSLLNEWLGHDIYFKAECLQRVGAFKSRGSCNTIAWLKENGALPKRIIANSSGNHAQAVAWAARAFGVPATIYMPANVSSVKAQATRAYGADTVICDDRPDVDARTRAAAAEPDVYWIPPYNHEHVICGQGTAAHEAIETLGDVDAVFAPCGGGGLVSGTFIATRGLSKTAKVIGVEPLNANDAAESRRTGSIQSLSNTPDTIADGVMTLSVGDLTFPYIQQLDDFYEVSEDRILYWTQWINHLLKLHVEPTSCMVMDGVSQWLSGQRTRQRVLVILSGGNIDAPRMQRVWEHDYLTDVPSLNREGELS